MNIEKILNNNVVTTIGEDGIEKVIMGRGIAFKKKIGEEIEEDKIEKIFMIQNPHTSMRLQSLLNEIPIEYAEVSEEIIKHASEVVDKKLHEQIYLALTDHIAFALRRAKDGFIIKNEMLWEIKRIYRKEFSIGMWAINLIKEKLGVTLDENEAGFIALHIVNASLGQEMPDTMSITKLVNDILNIVKYHFKIELDEESLSYFRFITHLKFFAQRMFNRKQEINDDNSLYDVIRDRYQKSYLCVRKIKDYIQKNYAYELAEEEMVYLMLHIQRLISRKSE